VVVLWFVAMLMASGDMQELRHSPVPLHLAMFPVYSHVYHNTWIGLMQLLAQILLSHNNYVVRNTFRTVST